MSKYRYTLDVYSFEAHVASHDARNCTEGCWNAAKYQWAASWEVWPLTYKNLALTRETWHTPKSLDTWASRFLSENVMFLHLCFKIVSQLEGNISKSKRWNYVVNTRASRFVCFHNEKTHKSVNIDVEWTNEKTCRRRGKIFQPEQNQTCMDTLKTHPKLKCTSLIILIAWCRVHTFETC